MKQYFKLFITAFAQVFLVAISTVCLAKSFYIGAAVSGFFISFLWTFNVSRIAICTMYDRLVYASGACIGSMTGLFVTNIFI